MKLLVQNVDAQASNTRGFDRIPSDSVWDVALKPHRLVLVCILFIQFLAEQAVADEATFSLVSPVPGVYLHTGRHEDSSLLNQGDIANIGFIVGDCSVMVIDPGGSPYIARRLLRAVRDITPLPISHTVLTHIHPDHILGSQVFVDKSQLVAHKRYSAALAQRGQFYLDRFSYYFAAGEKSLPLPDLLVDDELTVDLGNRSVVIRAHRTAHTDHDLSILDITTGTVWASDLVFAERIPSLDGSIIGWRQVTQSLLNEGVELIIPGHGKPGRADEILQPQLRYLSKLETEVRAEVANNTRLAEAVETVAIDEKPHWLLFDLNHAGNVTKAFTELEWE